MGIDVKGTVEYGADLKGLDAAVQGLEAVAKESAELADTLRAVNGQSDRTGKGLKDVGDKAKQGQRSLESTADSARKLGQAFTEVQRVAKATVGRALSEFGRFESAMGQVATLSTDIAADFDNAQQQTLALSRAMGIDATDAANAFYQSVSASVKGASDAAGALGLLEVASQASVGGAVDLTVAVDGITTGLNAWGMHANEATRVSDIMFTSVAKGKTTFNELSANMFMAGPIAASMGVSLEEVAAGAATLTKSGVPTSVAMTQLKAAMVAMSKPGPELAAILQQIADENDNVTEATGQSVLAAMSMQEALALIRDKADESGQSLAKVFGRVEGAQAALTLSGDNLAAAQADLEAMENSAGASAAAYEVMAATFEHQSDMLKSSVQSAFIEIGRTLGSVLVPFMQQLTDLINRGLEAWTNLDEGTRRFIVTFGGLVAIIGPVVMGLQSMLSTAQAAASGLGLLETAQKALSASMLTNPVTAVILGIAAAAAVLITAVQGLNAEVKDQQQALAGTSADLDAYAAAIETADEQATGLGGILGSMRDAVRDAGWRESTADIREAADAWLQYGVGVDSAVLKAKDYKQAKLELDQQLVAGTITVEQYKQALLAEADAVSQVLGKGRVLTTEQRKQAQAFAESQQAIALRSGEIGQALVTDEQYNRTLANMAELVAQGKVSEEAAANAIARYTEVRTGQIETEREAAAAAAESTGALYRYSAGFADLSKAGSQWVDDSEAMAEAMAKLDEQLAGGLQEGVQGLWDARKDLSKNLAEAAAQDAAAQQAARDEVAAGAAEHNAKLLQLEERLGKAKTDASRIGAEQAIAKEQERWAAVNSLAENGTGEHTAKVRAAYAEQVQITKDAIAQTIVDYINGQVLLGQTSEETAKAIYSNLRSAFPDVEVFSPVQDVYVDLLGTVREAAAGNEEAIDSLAQKVQDVPDALEDQYQRAEATLDSWQAEYEATGEAAEDGATRIVAAGDTAAAGVAASTDAALSSYQEQGAGLEDLADTSADTASSIETDADRVVAAADEQAEQTVAAIENERTGHYSLEDTVLSTGSTVRGEYKRMGAHAETMADDTVAATGDAESGVEGLADTVEGSGKRIETGYDNAASAVNRGLSGITTDMSNAEVAFMTGSAAVDSYTDSVADAGVELEDSLEAGGEAAEDSGSTTVDALEDTQEQAEDTADSIGDLAEVIDELPTEIEIPLTLLGIEQATEDAVQLLEYLLAFPARMQVVISTMHMAEDEATDESPSLNLLHWIEDTVAYAGSNPVVVTTSYSPQSPLLAEGSSGNRLAWLDAYEDAVNETANQPIEIRAKFTDDSEAALQSGADQSKLLLQEQLEGLIAVLAGLQGAEIDPDPRGRWGWIGDHIAAAVAHLKDLEGIDPQRMQQIQDALDVGDLEQAYDLVKDSVKDLAAQEDRRYKQRIAELKLLAEKHAKQGSELEDIEQAIEIEKQRHEQAKAHLDQYADQLEDLYDNWEYYEEALAELRKRLLEEAEAHYDRLEDEERSRHDEVMRLIDEEADRRRQAYEDDIAAIDARAEAAKAAHEDRIDQIETERRAIQDEQYEADKVLRKMGRDLKQLELDLDLDSLKDYGKDIKDAMADLPREGTRDARLKTKTTDEQLEVLQRAQSEGRLGDLDQDLQDIADKVLSGKRVSGNEMRALLEALGEDVQDELESKQALLDAEKEAYERAKLRHAEDKEARQDELRDLAEAKRIAGEDHTERMAGIAAEKQAREDAYDTEQERIDALREAEERRHEDRLAQIAQEAAIQKALIEGKTEDEIRQEIDEAMRTAERIRREAEDILRQLAEERAAEEERRRRAEQVQPGVDPILPPGVPGLPGPGLPGPVPGPLPVEVEGGAGGGLAGEIAAGMSEALGTEGKILPPGASLDSSLAATAGVVAPVTNEVANNFYAPIIVGDLDELEDLLRETLDAFGS